MKIARRSKMAIVRRLEDIPAFASEDEEREWWATHDLSDELYAELRSNAADPAIYRIPLQTPAPED